MTRSLTLVVTLAVAAILAVATAGELAWAPHHSGSSRHRGTVSSSSGSTDTLGWWNSPWASMMGAGGMMGPGGRYVAAVDEPQYLAEMITHHQEGPRRWAGPAVGLLCRPGPR